MDDDGFDRLLTAAGERSAVPQALLDRMVEGLPARRARRTKPLMIGGAIAAGLLLAAAATSDQWMHQEPFSSLPVGTYRVQEPITVRWAMDDGEQDTCFAFLEYSDLSVAQADRADASVHANQTQWQGLGQRLVGASGTASESYERAEAAVLAGLDPVLHEAAQAALPEALPNGLDSTTAARVSGYAIHCHRDRP